MNIRLEGANIYLRELTSDDASQKYCDWLNDSEVNEFLQTNSATTKDLEDYIAQKNKSEDSLLLGIFWKETNEHIGNIKLEPINYNHSYATIGILIGNKGYWGKGVGTEAVNLVVDYAFKQLQLNEVRLGVLAVNAKAINLYKKCGFYIDEVPSAGATIIHNGQVFQELYMKKNNKKIL